MIATDAAQRVALGFQASMHRSPFTRWLAVALAGLLVGSCTDVGLYAAGTGGIAGPDRAEFQGTVCVPLAAGEAFPVKVLFALEGGAGVDRAIVGETSDALNALTAQFATPYISFGMIAYHAVATGLQATFVNDSRIATALAKYASYQEGGPISHRAPLSLAHSIISGDMQTSCRGQVARTRYLVVLVMNHADTSCANPVFNPGIDAKCNKFLPNESECSACELSRMTEELRALARTYNAGEVTVQPVYVYTTDDVVLRYQAAAIARAGGTELIQTNAGNIKQTLTTLNYASLQRSLQLKRLIAMNRNAISRNSELLIDSDGDGLPDDQEKTLGTDPQLVDSDSDGLSDGIELKMGLNTLSPATAPDIIKGCNVSADTDGDRLNDCEERVLGTDACISDSDGDGLPDLVEALSNTNPLIAEDLTDDDRDGLTNIQEIEAHTDTTSADIQYQKERGYQYRVTPAAPTVDGRPCYDVNILNVGLVGTTDRPSSDGTGIRIAKGTNDIYIYLQVGRENDPRGTGIGSLFVPQVKFIPPNTRKPKGIINFMPDDFVNSQ